LKFKGKTYFRESGVGVVDGTGPGWCSVVGFGFSGVDLSCSVTRVLLRRGRKLKDKRRMELMGVRNLWPFSGYTFR
jgi:hypothetical protein